jgi:hypothetical protein
LCAKSSGRPSGCHLVGLRQAQATAVRDHATVRHELLTRSEVALAVMAVLSAALASSPSAPATKQLIHKPGTHPLAGHRVRVQGA